MKYQEDRWLFLDMNSFFASVEQQERPELRDKPVAVAPMNSDSTCVIAASYAAKAYGVKTGVNIGRARQMCPELTVVEARPKIYIEYHTRMVSVLREELPDPHTLSVDEIACRLWSNEREPGNAVRLARHLKKRLAVDLGTCMKSSIGIAPNVFLAKVAADLQKPDGLTLLRSQDIPTAFDSLVLRDFPGIGKKMHQRLLAANIHTVSQLYAATEGELAAVWGGVVGRRWWHMLRGCTDADYGALSEPLPTNVSNSHVIEPSLRTYSGAEKILIRLLSKALQRLRIKGHMARRVHLSVSYQDDRMHRSAWKADSGRRHPASDLISWLPILRELWQTQTQTRSTSMPRKVSVAFSDLVRPEEIPGSLFVDTGKQCAVTVAIDALNTRYKRADKSGNIVDIASVYWLNSHAPERIAFRKITDDDRERA